jgi:DNA polymerase I-like protein with 3'-5' exonuclease and polymerase domains
VMAMEDRGVHISKKRTEEQRNGCIKKATHHMAIMQRMVDKQGFKTYSKPTKTGKRKELPFKPGSPAQLARLLYGPEEENGFDLECSRYTEKGGDSTDWKALRPHQEHPFVRELMMWRSSDKAIDTFFGKYLSMMRRDPLSPNHPDSYVLHCSLNQCGTGTGRFSSNDPNLQQVANPESSPRGTDVHAREPFGPRPGYFWYTPDYAQMELRCLADVGQIQGLLEIINSGEDPNNALTNKAWGGKGNPAGLEAMAHALELGHDYPAHDKIVEAWKVLGWNADKAQYGMRSSLALNVADQWLAMHDYDIVVAEKAIGKKQSRQRGKTVMFTNMYGGGADAVVDILFCTKKEALKAMKDISRAFPDIGKFMRELSGQAAEDGYIINKYDRKLRVDPRFAYRAVNYMIQSTCADLMKRGIQRCHDFLRSTGLDAHVLLTIHDELIFEIRKEHAYKSVLREISRIMSDTEGRLAVPMPVEMQKCRYSWEKKEPVDL